MLLAAAIPLGLSLSPPATSASALSTRDACLLFGALAEPLVHLDPEVGACCHSACSDCEWRLPDGGYRFDVLKATKPKWVPCYLRRDFGDERGCHEPRWASALFPGGGEVTRAQFGEALAGLGFEMPMGPRGSVGADGGMPESAADALWAWLAGDGDALTPEGARTRLQAMAEDPQAEGAVGEGPDHLVWKEFAKDAARGGRWSRRTSPRHRAGWCG